jgi:hypothetical protein
MLRVAGKKIPLSDWKQVYQQGAEGHIKCRSNQNVQVVRVLRAQKTRRGGRVGSYKMKI